MLAKVSQVKTTTNQFYRQPLKKISFKEAFFLNDEKDDQFQKEKKVDIEQQNKFIKNYVISTLLLGGIIGGAAYFFRNKPKKVLDIADTRSYRFESLKNDPKVPALENCKSINKDLKTELRRQLKLANADKDILDETGNPDSVKLMLLSGPPGVGKTYFSKIYAKTLDAEYLEILFSDLNSKWVGESEEYMTSMFDAIINQVKKHSEKKYVVTFNEIDALVLPVEHLTGGNGSTHFASLRRQRSIFLNYLDILKEKYPNVTLIGTTNLSPQNNNLDGAITSRLQKIMEIPYPDEECLYEALKLNLEKIKGKDEFISANDEKLKEMAKIMAERKFSFRNLEYVVNEAKYNFFEEKVDKKSSRFKFEYLENAQKSLKKSDGEKESL